MISYVSGKLVERQPTEVIVDVQGIGYQVFIPTSTYEKLPPLESAVKLLTYHHVREDAALLYGFATKAERAVFGLVITVSGIGPKLALAALSAMSATEFRDRVVNSDVTFLTRIPGVGKKVAERMVVELRDRITRVEGLEGGGAGTLAKDDANQVRADALAALEALGLSRSAAERSIRKVLRNQPHIASVEELIRLALREK